MFDRIMIANRGEIACRIARTARRLGIRTVAVHSDIDERALHVRQCDEAIAIGGRTAAESYLDIDRILEAAKTCQAEAVHPGYGFLSENPGFAARCKERELVFIGPDAASIRLMGAKDQAREVAVRAGVPVLPGYEGEEQDAQTLYNHACETGFPILIKATAGGGGKGMRAVHSKTEFAEALESVKRESLSAFGSDRVMLEQYLPEARHVEVQIFADSHGNIVHLYDRDCSLQRRHQKIVEEAPAPGLHEATRKTMTEAAMACARSIGYLGAGTVEFLLAPDQRFYFLEMNTRIQVEHPVTEMITGQDLVEWQFRVHSGERLPLRQELITLNGHSIESRICAENPANRFLPSSGRILGLWQPDPGNGVRIDTGIREGDTVSPYYDSMISKLVTWSTDREGARRMMLDSLRNYAVLGLPSNIDFLQSLIRSREFSAGLYDNRIVERNLEALLQETASHPPLMLCCAAAWDFLNSLQFQQSRHADKPETNSPWLLHAGFGTPVQRRYSAWYRYEGEQPQQLTFSYSQDRFTFEQPQIRFSAKLTGCSGMQVGHPRIDGPVYTAKTGGTLYLHANGKHHRIEIQDRFRPPTGFARAFDDALNAPLSGVVVDVRVERNQNVAKGEVLMILEAMKMEHSIVAPSGGVVQDIYHGKGEQVAENTPLLKIAHT